jgi:hypothetical protein
MSEASAYVRTQVRATNPEKGVYRTLDGRFEIRAAAKKGQWDLYRLEDGNWVLVQAEAGKYDAALTRILAEPGVSLEQLNTRPKPPAKPKPEPKPEAKAQPTGGRPSVKRAAKKVA